MKKWLSVLCLLLFLPLSTPAEAELSPREQFIDAILQECETLYVNAGGKRKRAHYASDIYVCKNFTTYVFHEAAGGFRMAEFPDVPLVIPDNQTKNDCKPYVYGVEWKNVSAA